ncbi:hypothetical protein [Priestia megaterium]|uniref:hypothetical protein n=1 Tax=Priestia megaterium TaxID=1404 RepID=UPI0039F702F2
MAKNAISVVLDKVNKADYATFESMGEMREAVNAHVKTVEESDLRPNMKKKLVRLLDFLRDNSRIYLGLSFKKQRVIADFFGVKKADTIGEWFKKLAELGCVKVIATKRSRTMHQTANFVQIMPVEKVVEQEAVQEKRVQDTAEIEVIEDKNGEHEDNLSSNTKTKNNNIRKADAPVPSYIPNEFADLVKCYYPATKDIFELYGKFRLAFLHTTKTHNIEDFAHIAVSAFKEAVSAIKLRDLRKGKSFDSLRGYLYGTARKMVFTEIARMNKKNVVNPFESFGGLLNAEVAEEIFGN